MVSSLETDRETVALSGRPRSLLPCKTRGIHMRVLPQVWVAIGCIGFDPRSLGFPRETDTRREPKSLKKTTSFRWPFVPSGEPPQPSGSYSVEYVG